MHSRPPLRRTSRCWHEREPGAPAALRLVPRPRLRPARVGAPVPRLDYDWTRPSLYQQSARELERAGFDFVLIEDAPSLGSPETIDLRVRHAFGGPKHDPLMLAPYVFQATERLGVVPTVNPAATLPYTAAR